MKKTLLLSLLFVFALSTTSSAQFNIKNKVKSRFEKKGKDIGKKKAEEAKEKAKAEAKAKGEEELEKAETIGMEEAEKGLDKARVAGEPGLQKAEEYNKIGEEYTLFGLNKAQEFAEGYEEGVASKNPKDYKRYAFESAIVEYKLEGSETGNKTIYIDGGGYKFAEYKTIKEKRKEKKEASILIGADVIGVDYESKSAVKIHNPMAYYLANPNQNWEETAENMYIKMGFEKTGKENILGKSCEVWKHGKHQIWVWNGLTLKSIIGKTVETATSIKVDTKVSQTMFEVPKGFEYESVDASAMMPDFDEAKEALNDSDEDLDELLDEIENMTYSEYKAKVLEEDPNADAEKIRQSYLLLRQQAKRRKK